jgi:hypothetical protein
MSTKNVKTPRIVDINTSNETIQFRISYDNSKWTTQLILNGQPKFPTVPSKAPPYELNESRNKSILKILDKYAEDNENITDELMERAGEKAEELITLTNEEDEATPLEQKYDIRIIERANYILEKGDPFKFYLDKWKTCYAITDGDDSLGVISLCTVASTMISNSKGIHEKVGGPSGFGKSAGVTRMFALLPPEIKN